jgi:hypothetical protein
MLITLAIVIIILFLLFTIGFPIISIFFGKPDFEWKLDSLTVITLSLIVGFGVSAFSAATAYGITGIDTYFYILILFGISVWTYSIITKKIHLKILNNFQKKDFLILFPIVFSIYLSSSQWMGLLNPVIKSGLGPDTSQNLMAAQKAKEIGNNWFDAVSSIKGFLNSSTFENSALNLFRIPSSSNLAASDYLIFGGRWGLTVPFNQMSRFFGPKIIFWESSIVILMSLTVFTFIFFSIGKLLSKKFVLPTMLSLAIISNSAFLYQYFNGGLSQAVGSISLSGLLLMYIIIIKSKDIIITKLQFIGIFFVTMMAWTACIVTYIDSLFIFTASLLFSTFILFFFSRPIFKKIILIFTASAFMAFLIVPIATYSHVINLRLRLKAAQGTGLFSDRWGAPTDYFGFINNFSTPTASQPTRVFTALFTILIISILIYSFIRSKQEKDFIVIGVGAFIVIFFGYLISINSNQKSSYIYEKISTYLAPLVITSIFLVLSLNEEKKYNSKKIVLLSVLTSISVLSAVNFQQTYFNTQTINTIPYGYKNLLEDKVLQKNFSKFNYLIPYKSAYNYMGYLGASYWISKAPNDFILDSRLNNELRLLCFITDPSCKPNTKKIVNLDLESKYGLVQFESPVSTNDYSKLSIVDKYNVNFDVFGMERISIPEKYMGGNPYYK